LEFNQWLQWVFLPRMKLLLEQGMELPAMSGIQPMAELFYSDLHRPADRLFRLIGEMDRLLST
jgi:uncharacterized protein YqcC (DUF446 family)